MTGEIVRILAEDGRAEIGVEPDGAGQIMLDVKELYDDGYALISLSPAQTRDLATKLLEWADSADGGNERAGG